MNTAIIGMGTNLGDRMDNLNRAVQALKRLPRTKVTGASHLYETQPVGYLEQGPFLNANLMVETDLSPMALLGGMPWHRGRIRPGADHSKRAAIFLIWICCSMRGCDRILLN